jgi:hypothetical protein
MQAVRIALLALCCAAPVAAQEMPSTELIREVELRLEGALLPERHAAEESRRAIAVLRAYAATGEERYFHDALRRARHLAAFEGRTSLRESLTVAWALALACDWLAQRLDAEALATLRGALSARANILFDNAWPESVPALTVIARVLSGEKGQGHDQHSKLWQHEIVREV